MIVPPSTLTSAVVGRGGMRMVPNRSMLGSGVPVGGPAIPLQSPGDVFFSFF